MRSRAWVFLSFMAVTACQESVSEPLSDLLVVVGEGRYSLGEPVLLEIRNVTDADAFFHHCNDEISVVAQKAESGRWVEWARLNGPVCPAIYSSGVVVLVPGSAYESTLRIDEAGSYRISVETGMTSSSIGSQVVYSNAFAVEPAAALKGRSGV